MLRFLVLAAGGLVLGGFAGSAAAATATVIRSDDGEVAVRVTFEAPETRCVDDDRCRAIDLTVPGLPRHRAVGELALPFRPILIAVPPGATVRLEVDDPQPTLLSGLHPAAFALPVDQDNPLAIATDPAKGRSFESVEIDFDGFLRNRRVVRLIFHPLTTDPRGRGSIYHPQLTARLVLDSNRARSVFRDTSAAVDREPQVERFERTVYARTILNEHTIDAAAYREELGKLRGSPPEPVRGLAVEGDYVTRSGSGPLPAKIPVDSEDIWSITHAALLAAGLDAGGTASTDLSLTVGGSVTPLRVIDGGDGTFDAGDRVEIYGAGITGSLEYDTNVYRLAFDEGPGTPVATRDAMPAGGTAPTSFVDVLRFEDSQVFFTTHADSDGDQIGWERVVGDGGGNATVMYDFTLPDVDPAATNITVRVRAYDLGGSHTTSPLLNGVDLMDSRSFSTGDVTHTVMTAAANLVPGTNTLTLQLSGSVFNQVVFNWFEIEYPRLYRAENDRLAFTADLAAPVAHQISGFTTSDVVVYDITDPATPVRLENVQVSGMPGDYAAAFTDTLGGARRFIARAGTTSPTGPLLADQPSNLGATTNGADLIVLAYRDFVDEMVPLVNARLAQGWRVELVDLEDVFDEYAFGRPDPAAIKAFLTEAYSAWQAPAPAFLLLVGNATLDPLQQLPGSVPPLMPTGRFIAPTLGLAASDNALVTFLGADPLPDMFVGRISAQTEGQVADVVAKIVAYDSVSPDLLNQRILLVADDDQSSFETVQEDLVSLYLSDTKIPAERAYLRLLGVGATNQKIRDTINLGALTTNYYGHGNIHNLAAENIFVDSSDLPLLTNSDRPTFMTTLNCINGFHAGPRTTSLDSLAEQALLATNGGAMGVWSPSALGLASDYSEMSEVLYRLLFVDREQTLGVATTMAKIEAYTLAGASVATLDEMHLFGDPTTVLRVDGDLDGLTDFEEDAQGLLPRDADADDDGLDDGAESMPFGDSDGDGLLDALDADADDDGLPDGLESGIVTPGPDTDIGRGHFIADADPLSTTDPTDADTDGGGAPDGAEDRNVNGQVDGVETDPQNPADDPACSIVPPTEISGLQASKNGADIDLSWIDQTPADPCVLYRVYVATNAAPSDSGAFVVETTATLPGWTHPNAYQDSNVYWYLATSISPIVGEGPRGHHGQ